MTRGNRAIAAFLAFAFFPLSPPATATELWTHGDMSLSLTGTIRQLALYTRQTDSGDFTSDIADDIAAGNTTCVAANEFENCPAFNRLGDKDVGQGLTRLRLDADLHLTKWLSAKVVYDNDIQYGAIDTLEAALGDGLSGGTFIGAEANLDDGAHHDWNHRLYRGYLRAETEHFELGVGRQRVAWGVGRLWNPIDRFSALPPLSLQPDVTPGIDGVNGQFNFDGFNFLQFVYTPGARRREERWALRLHGVVWDADVSLMGGAFERAPTFGMDFASNLGDAAIGIEAVYTSPKHKVWMIGDSGPRMLSDYWQVVASIDTNLDYGTGLYVLAEYLYNGNDLGVGDGRAGSLLPLFEATDVPADPALELLSPGPYVTNATIDVFGSSRVITSVEHQLGLQLGYELTPELRGDLVTLIDMTEGSAAFFPNLAYSPLDSVELTLGVQLFAGPNRSQYGASEPLVYILADFFF